MIELTVLAASIAAIISATVFAKRTMRDGQWRPENGQTMRRFTNGKLEYRDMTNDERLDYADRQAW